MVMRNAQAGSRNVVMHEAIGVISHVPI